MSGERRAPGHGQAVPFGHRRPEGEAAGARGVCRASIAREEHADFQGECEMSANSILTFIRISSFTPTIDWLVDMNVRHCGSGILACRVRREQTAEGVGVALHSV